jgi:peptidoglycan/xylan/chitin deacetylase (PgdA/CDA1 family)
MACFTIENYRNTPATQADSSLANDAAARPQAPADERHAATAQPPPTLASPTSPPAVLPPGRPRTPNLGGRIPILEYHLIGETDGRWQHSVQSFRRDLQMLHDRGYRPISMASLLDNSIDLPDGFSPVVFTFDDASPSQFRFMENNGELAIDSLSALGIWLDFRKKHPDWSNKAVFCLLSGAEAGRSFFGDKEIEGQKSEWRHRKLRALVDSGFELCNHTVWHANLARQDDQTVVEQIARLNLAIDSAVPQYRVRVFALPLGEWPARRDLARTGRWRDPRSGVETSYGFDAILQVSGGPARSPSDSLFNPLRLPRVQVIGNDLERLLDQLDRSGTRYVSAGRPAQN